MWTIVLFSILLCIVNEVGSSQHASSFSSATSSHEPLSNADKFILCDLNRNQFIDKDEFQDCARFPASTNLKDAIEEIYSHFDVDKDLQLSRREFELYFEMITDHEREVEVTTSDGKKKTMKQGEFIRMEEEKRKGYRYENGQVSKVNEGSSNIDSIKEENPELSRFITIGQWAHHHITQLGYASGNITGLKSIDEIKMKETEIIRHDDADDDDHSNSNYFEMKLELTIKESQKIKSKNLTFEVLVAWDPAHYVPPHLVMKSITRLDKTKDGEIIRTSLAPPHSKQRQWPFTILYYLARFCSEATIPLTFFSMIALVLLAGIYFFCAPKGEEGEEEGEGKREREGDEKTVKRNTTKQSQNKNKKKN